MTVGHLAFACLISVYVWVGIHLEERTLLRTLAGYEEYRRSTPMLIPRPRWGRSGLPAPVAAE